MITDLSIVMMGGLPVVARSVFYGLSASLVKMAKHEHLVFGYTKSEGYTNQFSLTAYPSLTKIIVHVQIMISNLSMVVMGRLHVIVRPVVDVVVI